MGLGVATRDFLINPPPQIPLDDKSNPNEIDKINHPVNNTSKGNN